MSPAAELRAAARTLRTLAEHATPSPWEDVSDGDDGAWPRLVVNPGSHAEVLVVHEEIADYGVVTRPDTAWIARVHPGLAGPLAALLEAIADDMDAHGAVEGSESKAVHPATPLGLGAPNPVWTAALATARTINGTEEETAS